MRLRNIPGARETIAASEYVVHEDVMREKKGKWDTVFEKAQPLYLEVGMGKGRFITQLAGRNPENNYVGIEKYSSVLLRALEKRELLPELTNLRYLRMDAEDLPEVFGEGEVSGIYLNFSDPWPKTRHEKRRLTYKTFLANYQQVVKPGGGLEFKTDNQGLFEYSLTSLNNFGMIFDGVWLNLHESPENEGNVETEYEQRFASLGQPIYKLKAHFPVN